MSPLRLQGFGLRTRLTIAFALGALVLSSLFAVLTYLLSRNYLLHQREASARRQAYVNARLISEGLRADNADAPALLASLETPADSQSLIYRGGEWFATSVAIRPTDLPSDLRNRAQTSNGLQQLFSLSGQTAYAIAIPLAGHDRVYYEVFSFRELRSTLHVLGLSLLAGAIVTTVAGGSLGLWASRRTLRPLRAVAVTAGEIAQGNLASRLRPGADEDLAHIARSFNAMVDSVQQRVERDARFASDVSHELRSPLTTLSTAASVLKERSRTWDLSSRQAVDLVAQEVANFQRLVEDLLEMARSSAGTRDLSISHVPLGELVMQVVANSQHHDVSIDVDADASATVIAADKRRFERVLTNILDNAKQHGGGVRGIGVVAHRNFVRVFVDDAGPGVPEGEREHIFERFGRASTTGRQTGGSGLGLAIVREHVHAMDGHVWVEEGPEGGARFVVEFPAQEPGAG
jgi:two-component system sensor histidine kinase MtrB